MKAHSKNNQMQLYKCNQHGDIAMAYGLLHNENK
jgi:hypothetical protein